MRRLARLSCGLAALLLATPATAERVLVFAAASLGGTLDEALAPWEAATGHDAVVAYAGSSALARQIEAGAPAQVFISANEAWMDSLDAAALLAPGTRRDLLGNSLVLISGEADVLALEDLPQTLGEGWLAMALTQAVPAGIYGREALVSLDLWDSLEPRVVQAEDVRAALALVALGEAPFGITYASDAAAEPRVHVAATFPADSHAPIRYPAAALAGSGPVAVDLLDWLSGPEAGQVFAAAGFDLP
ncbi:molybdate ABC transporter substrate-binding protein [Pseudoroseicyclus aestuarii]|uniref:Molybdate transport system substrate-binding protein n=1 Tax=Pseudoroseicyclus aestuarii TaxID=1795041 RepID=A0A318SS05_9RHOB|nr:molybdate ABC transporter substrate-binding protein [Pseudoroseicyclus aestuarii]PYE80909.1 molybdate transport system substrate-binding protein [Pseudoroseicyclus aestuarii]